MVPVVNLSELTLDSEVVFVLETLPSRVFTISPKALPCWVKKFINFNENEMEFSTGPDSPSKHNFQHSRMVNMAPP